MTSMHILVVDDNPGDVALVRLLLNKAAPGQFAISVAGCLAEVAGLLQRETFDLILLDLGLPEMSGLDSLSAATELAPELPIIILSGQEDQDIALRAVREGAQDYMFKGSLDARQMVIAIHGAIVRKQTELSLARRAFYDDLTGLPTRALLQDRWSRARAKQQRTQAILGTLVIDLDDFKAINDSFGHLVGDAVLRAVAERITGALRSGDTLARIGGDEFVAILEDLDDRQDIAQIIQRIAAATTRPVCCDGVAVVPRVSIGKATIAPEQAVTLSDAIKAADVDMYQQKREKSAGATAARSFGNSPLGPVPHLPLV